MRRFTRLFFELDQTTRTSEKVAALERYFREVSHEDAAWALQFLSGNIPPRVIATRSLWDWAVAETKLPHWMIEECQDTVGDAAETLALIFPEEGKGTDLSLGEIVEKRLLPMRYLPDVARREMLVSTWRELSSEQRLVWNKLITGAFRIGVARTLVIRAVANVAGVPPAVMAHRVLGLQEVTATDFKRLLSGDISESETQPYPFFLASPIESKIKEKGSIAEALGDIGGWQVEWKWDGIRAQMLRRGGKCSIWSRGDEMVTDSFPEIVEAGGLFSDGTVLDGEIVVWRDSRPLPFAHLQRRLGRKQVGEAVRRAFPIVFLAYDLLEADGRDCRSLPLDSRRQRLEEIVARAARSSTQQQNTPQARQALLPLFDNERTIPQDFPIFPILVSPLLEAAAWNDLLQLQKEARERGTEGMMLKRRSSAYGVGRQRGDWWKWKIDPYVIDAVLIYAQRGQGRRASLYTDYTFGLWEDGQLVPVAKAYSGLSDQEIKEVDAFVRHNTTDRHGPVRVVKPDLVFELAFEGIQVSNRHRGGIAVRFPRMSRWRRDKKPEDADTLEALRALLPMQHDV